MTLEVVHVHAGNIYGGIETVLTTLARYADATPDVRHRFALCFEGRLADQLRAAGAQVDLLGATRVSRPWTIARARRRLHDLLATSKPNIVACHAPWSQAIFGPELRAAGAPLVFWMHGAPDGRHWLERWARRTSPDLALCNSGFTASCAPRLFPAVPAVRLYYPVARPQPPAVRREALRRELGAAPDVCAIVQVSRMEAGKGQRVLLEALALLRDRADWECWMVGGAQRGPEVAYEERLKRLARARGIEPRVKFLGQRSDVSAVLGGADMFCQPNIAPEAFGVSFIEALYSGLPVVGCRLGATPEIVDDSCGVLVEPENARALADALGGLLDDPRRRAAFAAAGPGRAAALCEPERQVRALAAALRGVAAGSRAAA